MKQSTCFQRNKELIFGVLVVAFAAFYLASTHSIETTTSVKVDSKLFPYMLGIIIGCIGLMQIRDGWLARAAIARANREQGVSEVGVSSEEWHCAWPVIGIFVLIVAFVVSLQRLGFVIASSGCLFFQILLLSGKGKRRPLLTAAVAVGVSVLIYLIFRKGLDLSLPEGLLDGVL